MYVLGVVWSWLSIIPAPIVACLCVWAAVVLVCGLGSELLYRFSAARKKAFEVEKVK